MGVDIERLKADESLWPDGAEYCDHEGDFYQFFALAGMRWFRLVGGKWLRHGPALPPLSFPRPKPADDWVDGLPEWDGQGLPPSGIDCEVWFDDGRECWHKARVLCEHSIENNLMAVVLEHEPHENKLMWVDQFRPLRTRAEREREEVIKAAVKVCRYPDSTTTRSDAEALYDANLLRKPAEEVGREELATVLRGAYVDGASDHRGGLAAIVDALSTYNVTKKGE